MTPWHMLSEEEALFCEVLERIAAEKIAPEAARTDETAALSTASSAF